VFWFRLRRVRRRQVTKQIGLLLTALGLLVSITACGNDDPAEKQRKVVTRVAIQESIFKATELENTVDTLIAAIDETEATDVPLHVNLKALTGYWEPVVVGANRAMSELDVDGEVGAPEGAEGKGLDTATIAETLTQQQATMLEEARLNGAKGFGVAAVYDQLIGAVDALVNAGLPVVTIDGDLGTSKRDLYIGTLNADAGKTAGNSLKALLPAAPGTVVILGYEVEDWKDGYDRTMGTKSVLEESGYSVIIRRTSWADGGEEQDIQFMAETISTATPPVVGMIGMFSNAYRCAMAAEAAGKSGSDIAIAAFDFDPKTVGYMQSGMIKVTHAQRQYYMGYLTPYILYGINVLGKAKTKALLSSQMVDDYRFDAGLDVVKAEHLDQYYSFLDKLGISGS
jgi:ribose transport system substrate-binding protein